MSNNIKERAKKIRNMPIDGQDEDYWTNKGMMELESAILTYNNLNTNQPPPTHRPSRPTNLTPFPSKTPPRQSETSFGLVNRQIL